MDAGERRSRFERRVRTEREFLSPVNRVFGDVAPLAGMTHDAIHSWRSRAERAVGRDLSGVAGVLIEASARADLMADNSKDVFEPTRRPAPDSLGELGAMLAIALGAFSLPV
jgi:hypothetical protein